MYRGTYARGLALALLLIGGCTAPGDKPWIRYDAIEKETLSLSAVSGPQLRRQIDEAEAEVVLLNVWATWCVTCREEFPDLLRIRKEFGPRGVAVIFVSGDFASERPAVLAMLRELGVSFPTYIKEGADMAFIDALEPEWSGALPASFVFARGGRLLDWWEGARTYEGFAGPLEEALALREGAR